jgi:glycosyl transferase family 2
VKLVMTLRTRDEADVVDANVAFHLNAGVDFVIATDHRSEDGTIDILERYVREGHLHLIRERGEEMNEGGWATRMSQLAAREFGADWVISSDADEFWWPRGGSLKEVLGSIPDRYGIVRALLRQFVPRPDDGEYFAERMIARVSGAAPINAPTSLFRPNVKSIHRGDRNVKLSAGAHMVLDSRLVPLRGWYPVEFLHFPIRSFEQCDRKYRNLRAALGQSRNSYYDDVYRARSEGRFAEFYESITIDDAELERGIDDGSLVIDTRLRDSLRTLRSAGTNGGFGLPAQGSSLLSFPRPSVVDDAAYALDVAALGEADVVRIQRRLDALEPRLQALEGRPSARLYRTLRKAKRRLVRPADGQEA